MKGRRSAILARREAEGMTDTSPLQHSNSLSLTEANGSVSQPIRSVETASPPMGFTAVNTRASGHEAAKITGMTADDLFPSTSMGKVTIINGRSIKDASPTERAEMMKKFRSSNEREPGAYEGSTRRSSMGTSSRSQAHGEGRPRSGSIDYISGSAAKNTATVAIPGTPASLMPQVKSPFLERDDGGPFKSEMVSRMESMHRGERVIPPCDRCRRLHMDCLKNLTACMGCTKKHAKCSWKDVRPDELNDHDHGSEGEEPLRHADHEHPSPPRTVAEVTRQIEENARPSNSESAPPEKRPEPEDTVMHETSNVTQHDPAPARPEPPIATEEPLRPPSPRPAPTTSTPIQSKFDVKPPAFTQQLQEAASRYSPPRYSSYSTYPPMQKARSLSMDDNDEGDRLQALAAQVYRSASQSVKPQESAS
jgi:hypothetical protein